MRAKQASVSMLAGLALGALLVGSASASINYNASKSNTGNVYFADLNAKGQATLRKACAAHGGQIVTNDKGQLGCQVRSLNDSKNISDGAAKGQANE